ncbi:dephospho-CoA kinase [Flavipsychrobacter stenotrophus]|uniref:Dephospho-CoA kinase n=1 Tax=Flavipsychrobacter stenotrophus TaxID=2077091 RepID=A0A2S7SR80_9BACT|nr:dephospho-CoA kinase [Flavipsychrobacter stenotrophus]PQJ09056.1 dephospho-CoA kinase [Flavipsychrobacter stenotrophus]
MLKVGITGGIGSGKSVVCKVFETLGISVFNADNAARYLMENDEQLITAISRLLGNEVYNNNRLDRARVSDIIFRQPEKLQQLNALVHPATITYAAEWVGRQQAPYIIKEAAIFFESGSYKEMDVMVGVYAPKELRIARTMARGGQTREKVLDIISKQMNEEEKMGRCDYVITNEDVTAITPQVLQLNELFLKK